MAIIRATVTLPLVAAAGALDRDTINHTWWFESAVFPDQAIANDISGALFAFYATDVTEGPFTGNVSENFSTAINGEAVEVKMYDMADPEPRVPFFTETSFDLPIPTSGGNLPHEVALCLSFDSGTASGVNRARRRGRVYLGPFNAGADLSVVSQDARPGEELMQVIRAAAVRLRDQVSEVTWVQRSETTGAVAPVQTVWVDNAWDTQRRRGVAATLRMQNP